MVKRRYKKRSFKRRRVFKKKRSFRKRRYDGVIKRMVLAAYDVVTTGGSTAFFVNWKGDTTSPVLGDVTYRPSN